MEIDPRSHIQKYNNHNIRFYKFILFVGTLKIITIDNLVSRSLHQFSIFWLNVVACFINNIADIINQI